MYSDGNECMLKLTSHSEICPSDEEYRTDSQLPQVEPLLPDSRDSSANHQRFRRDRGGMSEGDGIELTAVSPTDDDASSKVPTNGGEGMASDTQAAEEEVFYGRDGPDIVSESLHKFAREGRVEELRRALDWNNGRLRRLVNMLDDEMLSPLHYAARYNSLECVQLLVEKGKANINIHNDERATPLHYAARYRRRRNVGKQEKPHHVCSNQKRNHSSKDPIIGASKLASMLNRLEKAKPEEGGETGAQGLEELIEPGEISKCMAEAKASAEVSYKGAWGMAVVNAKRLIEEESVPTPENSVIMYLVSRGSQVNQQDFYGCTALHYAAMRGNEIAAFQLLSIAGIDIEITDNENMTAAHLACCHDQVEIMKMLLNKNCSLTSVEESGCLPLHLAAAQGCLEMTQLLVEAAEKTLGSDAVTSLLNQSDHEMNTPLHAATMTAVSEVADLFIRNGSDVNLKNHQGETSLHMAAHCGSLEMAKLLVASGAQLDSVDMYLQTPLHRAAEQNHGAIIDYLISNGAGLERQDTDSYTPLLLAAAKGHIEAIKFLLKNDADIHAIEKSNKTALFLAAEEKYPEVVKILLADPKGSDLVDVPDKYNNTPLHIASQKGHLGVIEMLMSYQAVIDSKNEDEQTPMHLAAESGHIACVRALSKSATRGLVHAEDEDSNTPLHLAANKGHHKVVSLLLDLGAEIEARNSRKWTPLDCAAAKGHYKAANILLNNDSPVNPVDKSKVTPLYLACKNDHVEMVQLLLYWNADVSVRTASESTEDPTSGYNCLDIAIDMGNKRCAKAIIRSPHWEIAMRNQTTLPDGTIDTPMRKLIRKMPDVAEDVFDRCTVTNNYHPEHPKFKVTFNYEFLDDSYAHWKDERQGAIGEADMPAESASGTDKPAQSFEDIYDDNGKVRANIPPYSNKSAILKKNHPLMIMSNSRREDLLAHRLVISLLRYKWSAFGRVVYYINLALYCIFLTFLTVYILDTKGTISYLVDTTLPEINQTEPICQQVQDKHNPKQSLAAYVCKFGVMILACMAIIKELLQIVLGGLSYFSFENIMEWSIYVTSFITVLDINECEKITGVREAWQWQTGAAAIFLAWLNLVLFLRKVPRFGIYVVMFTDILKTFARFFVVFFLFILAFSFGFFTLLNNQTAFKSVGQSILKTSVMMIGEFDYDTIFNSQYDSNDSGSAVFYDGITYLLFIFFLILMSIIIMNLLVGLAVDDIKAVQEQAVLKRLAMQVDLALGVEALLPHMIRRKFVNKSTSIKPNSKLSFFQRYLPFLNRAEIGLLYEQEMDDMEKVQENQERMETQLGTLKRRLRALRSQNDRIVGMLNAVMVKVGATFVEDNDENEMINEEENLMDAIE